MKILLVDDDARYAGVLAQVLKSGGHPNVDIASSGEAALTRVRNSPYDLLITDLRMGGMDGLTLMGEVKRRSAATRIILMTAFADVETARTALKRGAMDYLVKPFDNSDLLQLVNQAALSSSLEIPSTDSPTLFSGMVGQGPLMQNIFARIHRAATSDASVLVLGPSGTGKELAARAIHGLSPRHSSPFVVIHSPGIPESLIESELFGHEKGAFTGADSRRVGQLENANGGTVFFDEIGELPLTLQPKLLRFLQERQFTRVGGHDMQTVDVRIVAATNRDLEKEVREGRFREDLFYRLDVIRIPMPPLKDRREDIPAIATHILKSLGRDVVDLSEGSMENLLHHDWPGNVRELQNALERAVVDAQGGAIQIGPFPVTSRTATGDGATPPSLDFDTNERRVIEEALKQSQGNKALAARTLGITRRKLYSRMERLGMAVQDDESVP